MNLDPDIEALKAMRHVLRKDNDVEETIERMIDEKIENDEEVDY